MNTTVAMPNPASALRESPRSPHPSRTPGSRAMIGVAAVVALTMLSFFVHVLQQQMQRGETIRAQFRSGAYAINAANGANETPLVSVVSSVKARAAIRGTAVALKQSGLGELR